MKNNPSQRKINYALPILIGLFVAAGMFIGAKFVGDYKLVAGQAGSNLEEAVKIINRNYVDSPYDQKLMSAAITAMLKNLNPYCNYIPAKNIGTTHAALDSAVVAYMGAPGVGYIRLNHFTATTLNMFTDAFSRLRREGLQSLILDLRGSSGSYLTAATQIADQFLADNQLIVYTQGRRRKKEEYRATDSGSFERGRLIVLIDEQTASAGEIVSGALQDQDRAILIGRRSFGKGIVQEPFTLPDGSIIRLTVARYYTPSGRHIQKPYNNTVNGRLPLGGGIMPDVFIPMDTAYYAAYYQKLIAQNLLNDFSIHYVNAHRKALKSEYPDFQSFNQEFDVKTIYSSFVTFAAVHGVSSSEKGYNASIAPIQAQLSALFARQLFNRGYYHELNEHDSAYSEALHLLNVR